MRVIFFGTAEFAVPSLEQLVAHQHTILLCVTQPDRPQGRGRSPAPSPVKRAALRLGLALSQPERLARRVCDGLHPELGVVVAYGQLIRTEVLGLPTHGMAGVHPSLLPKYRGAAPIAWALLNGETATGVTIFRLCERLDAGEIIAQEPVAIEPAEYAEALTKRLAYAGAAALVRAVGAIAAGQATFTPQDDSQASFAPKLTKAQGRIDWQASAQMIERLVRATVPWPGATTSWHGESLKIWRASVGIASTRSVDRSPGTVLQVETDALSVATGQGRLDITGVQPAGRRRMSMQEFLAGHPVRVGEHFGGVT